MQTTHVTRRFESIGARVKFTMTPRADVLLDVKKDRQGSYFEIAVPQNPEGQIEFQVLDTKPGDRHLLLLSKETRVPNTEKGVFKHRFLCGHDERSWFVAGIRGTVSSVNQAKADLKPAIVHGVEQRLGVKPSLRNRRRNAGSVRQGEWFFVPEPDLNPGDAYILRNEPLRQGRRKPHIAEYLYRVGGRLVYVNATHPDGISESSYRNLIRRNPDAKNDGWQTMRRNPTAYVKGRIKHPDHKTLFLKTWHRVLSNTESGRGVVFLD